MSVKSLTGNKRTFSDEEMLEAIRSDGMAALDPVYRTFREEFLRFGYRYHQDEEELADAYQDAVVILYENVVQGKLDSLNSTLKTYLFSIGKYILLNRHKKQKRAVHLEPELLPEEGTAGEIEHTIELTHQQRLMRTALDELGDPCRQLLILFYYHRYAIESIQHEMQYNSKNVVKATKSRCMKKLREILIRQRESPDKLYNTKSE